MESVLIHKLLFQDKGLFLTTLPNAKTVPFAPPKVYFQSSQLPAIPSILS